MSRWESMVVEDAGKMYELMISEAKASKALTFSIASLGTKLHRPREYVTAALVHLVFVQEKVRVIENKPDSPVFALIGPIGE